jgi:ubiquinone/menaquinone biosynthesis C-methylase UbiE
MFLEHIFEEDIPRAIAEFFRVTKKYAFLKVSIAHEKNTGWVNLYNKSSNNKIDNLHVSVLPIEIWKHHFIVAGFKINSIEMINKNCFEMILIK